MSRPDSGLAGWFLSEPSAPPTGDPFAPDAKVSTYDIYGYAGLDYSTYDLGCGGAARDPQATALNSTANLIHTPAMWLIALDNMLWSGTVVDPAVGVAGPLPVAGEGPRWAPAEEDLIA